MVACLSFSLQTIKLSSLIDTSQHNATGCNICEVELRIVMSHRLAVLGVDLVLNICGAETGADELMLKT